MNSWLFNIYTDGNFFSEITSYIISGYVNLFGDIDIVSNPILTFFYSAVVIFYILMLFKNPVSFQKNILNFTRPLHNHIVVVVIFLLSITILFHNVDARLVKLTKLDNNNFYAKEWQYKPMPIQIHSYNKIIGTKDTFKLPFILVILNSIPNVFVYGIPVDDISDAGNTESHPTKFANMNKVMNNISGGKVGNKELFKPIQLVLDYFGNLKYVKENSNDVRKTYDYLYRTSVFAPYNILADALQNETITNSFAKPISNPNKYEAVVDLFEDQNFYEEVTYDPLSEISHSYNFDLFKEKGISSGFYSLRVASDRTNIFNSEKFISNQMDVDNYTGRLNRLVDSHINGTNSSSFISTYGNLITPINSSNTYKGDTSGYPITLSKAIILNRMSMNNEEQNIPLKTSGIINTTNKTYGDMLSLSNKSKFYKDYFNTQISRKANDLIGSKLTGSQNTTKYQNIKLAKVIFNHSFMNEIEEPSTYDFNKLPDCLDGYQYNKSKVELKNLSNISSACKESFSSILTGSNKSDLMGGVSYIISDTLKYAKQNLFDYNKVLSSSNDPKIDYNSFYKIPEITGLGNEKSLRTFFATETKLVDSSYVRVVNDFLSPFTDLILFEEDFLNPDSNLYKVLFERKNSPSTFKEINNTNLKLSVYFTPNTGGKELIDEEVEESMIVSHILPKSDLDSFNIMDFYDIDKLAKKYKTSIPTLEDLSIETKQELVKLSIIEENLIATISNIKTIRENNHKNYIDNLKNKYNLDTDLAVFSYIYKKEALLNFIKLYKKYILTIVLKTNPKIEKMSELKLHKDLLLATNTIIATSIVTKTSSNGKFSGYVRKQPLKYEAGFYFMPFYKLMLLNKLPGVVVDNKISDKISLNIGDLYEMFKPETEFDFLRRFGYSHNYLDSFGKVKSKLMFSKESETGFDANQQDQMIIQAILNYKDNMLNINTPEVKGSSGGFITDTLDAIDSISKVVLTALSNVSNRALSFDIEDFKIKQKTEKIYLNSDIYKSTTSFVGYHSNPFKSHKITANNINSEIFNLANSVDSLYTSENYNSKFIDTYHSINEVEGTYRIRKEVFNDVLLAEKQSINATYNKEIIDGTNTFAAITFIATLGGGLKNKASRAVITKTGSMVLKSMKFSSRILKKKAVTVPAMLVFGGAKGVVKYTAGKVLSMTMYLFLAMFSSLMIVIVTILSFIVQIIRVLFLPLFLAKVKFLYLLGKMVYDFFVNLYTTGDFLNINENYTNALTKEFILVLKLNIKIVFFFLFNLTLTVFTAGLLFSLFSTSLNFGVYSLPYYTVALFFIIFILKINQLFFMFFDNGDNK